MTILITGASGNLGRKLHRHLAGSYDLRLLDINPRGDDRIIKADLSTWQPSWVGHFIGVNTVVHLAADTFRIRRVVAERTVVGHGGTRFRRAPSPQWAIEASLDSSAQRSAGRRQ